MNDILEYERQQYTDMDENLCFIASMNYPSEQILEANGSIFMNIYAEGFAGKRFYNGVDIVDKMETECMNECLKTLNAQDNYLCSVQMSSGSQANITVYHALLNKGDTVLAGDTASFSHITHGIKGSFLDRYFNVVKYYLNKDDVLDYDEIERIALACKPTMLIAGGSNYSQPIDFKRFREIADKVGAILMADISHIFGLCITENHQSPVNHAHIITSTLHKTARGVRGAIIAYDKSLDKKIKFAHIPGLWGGSHLNNTLAKLQTFKEMQQPEFKEYIDKLILNTKSMCQKFIDNGINVVSGLTSNHLFCLDLTNFNINGKDLADILEDCGVVANANAIPNDTNFIKPHGIRFGCASVTTRGLTEKECTQIAQAISDLLLAIKDGKDTSTPKTNLSSLVHHLTSKYPLKNIYPNRYKYLFGDEQNEARNK